MILETFFERMREGDAKGISDLFAEDGLFDDTAGVPYGFHPLVEKGRKAIFEMFSKAYENGGFDSIPIRVNDYSMDYDIVVAGVNINSHASVTLDEQGLITELTIRRR